MAKVPPFGELIAATTTSAVHLEMRDAYTPDDQRFLDWQAGKLHPEHANPEWSAIVRSHTARGVHFRRTCVVSEPLAPFIRFEYEVTAAVSIGTGEIVEDELADDPSIVKLCTQAFEAAWERAIPHDMYRPV